MTDYWSENGITKPPSVVVCAACRVDGVVFAGARHWDSVMASQLRALKDSGWDGNHHAAEQGFINQFGEFLTRAEACEIVRSNGQPFDLERNGGRDDILFSEGLY